MAKDILQVGVNPIIWSNDDFRDLGAEITLEQCLEEVQKSGYAGSEFGHKFPCTAGALTPLLDKYNLQLVSAWHSLHLLDKPFGVQKRTYEKHLQFLQDMNCRVVIVAECSRRVYNDPTQPLSGMSESLSEADWARLTLGLEQLAEVTCARGMTLVYHQHMGTVIQNQPELDRLMRSTRKMQLLLDTGHLAFAGMDPLAILDAYKDRVAHVHLKDVRDTVVESARSQQWSFAQSVRSGVFTVPGDGGLDFRALAAGLKKNHYAGWLVVEAEQDPQQSPPLEYARMGRQTVRELFGV